MATGTCHSGDGSPFLADIQAQFVRSDTDRVSQKGNHYNGTSYTPSVAPVIRAPSCLFLHCPVLISAFHWEKFEMDNSDVMQLWAIQAALILDVGMLYSGNARLCEMTQCLRVMPVNRCRWYGLFKAINRSSFPLSAVTIIEDEANLTRSWLTWKTEETLRRVGYCAWVSQKQSLLGRESSFRVVKTVQ